MTLHDLLNALAGFPMESQIKLEILTDEGHEYASLDTLESVSVNSCACPNCGCMDGKMNIVLKGHD